MRNKRKGYQTTVQASPIPLQAFAEGQNAEIRANQQDEFLAAKIQYSKLVV